MGCGAAGCHVMGCDGICHRMACHVMCEYTGWYDLEYDGMPQYGISHDVMGCNTMAYHRIIIDATGWYVVGCGEGVVGCGGDVVGWDVTLHIYNDIYINCENKPRLCL